MKTTENYLAEIKEIRKMMEESSRFLSLSGLSGILIGIYALLGAFAAYQLIYTSRNFDIYSSNLIPKLIFIALTVLAISLVTVVLLTYKRAKKSGKKIWNPGSRLMLLNLAIPLISGGILIFIFVFRGIYEIISPACLIFYGLALVNAAKFTRQEIFYIGLIQVFLGILAALFPRFALLLWALGFGIIHVIYGAVMYFRYEHQTKA
ncbi:hypothetical protein [Maribellus maritimus]|uniref:hypothetical protein n=1 Tax=Maribellus maritimus TaxID=2870838 RepID=UPI001EEB6F17|nr:hypothetical protein [Maribellus maritimus]MCG6190815.1 hypothetical protein [Maribellus maritimus]